MVNRALEIFGEIDILVNNTGVSFPQSALKVTEEAWYITMNVSLKSLFFITQVIRKEDDRTEEREDYQYIFTGRYSWNRGLCYLLCL